MTSNSAVLKELFQLKQTWRDQRFVFTNEQSNRYAILLDLRRKRVKSFYENDKVFKAGSTK